MIVKNDILGCDYTLLSEKKLNHIFFFCKGHLNVRLLPEEEARHMSLAVTTRARTTAICFLQESEKRKRKNVVHEKCMPLEPDN